MEYRDKEPAIERRVMPVGELRVARADDGPTRIEGYAAKFDTLSEELFGFREKIAPGAFAESLARPDDVRALINHDPNLILGRNTAGTLDLSEDDKGLKFGLDLPDTSAARDLAESIDRGDISQCSFGFVTREESWEFTDDGEPDIRTLMAVDLFDISTATFPAYTDTAVALRSRTQWQEDHKPALPDFEMMRRKLDLQAKF